VLVEPYKQLSKQ